jgi:hypothetical protein
MVTPMARATADSIHVFVLAYCHYIAKMMIHSHLIRTEYSNPTESFHFPESLSSHRTIQLLLMTEASTSSLRLRAADRCIFYGSRGESEINTAIVNIFDTECGDQS